MKKELKSAKILNARGLWSESREDFDTDVQEVVDNEAPVFSGNEVFEEMRRQKPQRWILDEGDKITGLVHPESKEEAELEMARLGKTGDLHLRDEFEGSERWIAFFLPQDRNEMKTKVSKHANSLLSGQFAVVSELKALGVDLPHEKARVLSKAAEKRLWCETASKAELESYDPTDFA